MSPSSSVLDDGGPCPPLPDGPFVDPLLPPPWLEVSACPLAGGLDERKNHGRWNEILLPDPVPVLPEVVVPEVPELGVCVMGGVTAPLAAALDPALLLTLSFLLASFPYLPTKFWGHKAKPPGRFPPSPPAAKTRPGIGLPEGRIEGSEFRFEL